MSAGWCILPLLFLPLLFLPFLFLPLHFFLKAASRSLPHALRIPQESSSVVSVVAPKTQLASFPAPPSLPALSLSLSLSVYNGLSPMAPPSFLPWLSYSRSIFLPRCSACLPPRPRHCQPYDITQLPFMGNGGLPWRQQTPPVSVCLAAAFSIGDRWCGRGKQTGSRRKRGGGGGLEEGGRRNQN